jgi:DNA integrity scanning protein DisA with diadenylate cyclase activity
VFRGKRHLSAARFVINNSRSIAFVVSQDGGITAFAIGKDKSNGKNKLLAYKELEVLA